MITASPVPVGITVVGSLPDMGKLKFRAGGGWCKCDFAMPFCCDFENEIIVRNTNVFKHKIK